MINLMNVEPLFLIRYNRPYSLDLSAVVTHELNFISYLNFFVSGSGFDGLSVLVFFELTS